MKTKNIILYILISLIWGTTWLVIKFQLINASVTASVFYRFLLSSLIFFGINLFLKKNLKFSFKQHQFFFLQGIFNFSINYLLTYISEKYINSGLVALTFTILIFYNMLGLKFFFKRKIELNAIFGAIIGGLGIFILFYDQIISSNYNQATIYGIIIGLVATLSASFGNMASIKNHEAKIPVITINAFAMLYGSLLSLIIGLVTNESFSVNHNFQFYSSLLYLSLFGSVIAFYAYQTLIVEIGADKAAYTSIISPVLAVYISMQFEHFQLTNKLLIGMILALLGNILVLNKKSNIFQRKLKSPL